MKEGRFKFEITISNNNAEEIETDRCKYELELFMPGPPKVVTEKLEPACMGVDYYTKVEIDGGFGKVTFTAEDGGLPAGLALNARTGEISGVPTAIGTKQVKVGLRDEKNRESSKQIRVNVSEKPIHGVTCGVYHQTFSCVADHKERNQQE